MKSSTLKRIIYIIEDSSKFFDKGLAEQALYQAMANLAVQDGFIVKETANAADTGKFLLLMTKHLSEIYSVRLLWQNIGLLPIA